MTQITLQHINQYLAMIRINFENAYKTQSDIERQMLIKSWYEILKEYPKEVCDRAVISAIRNAEFAPRIGSIVKEIEAMQEALQKPENELWSELMGVLRRVASNAYYYRFNAVQENGLTQGQIARMDNEKIFENLSPELKSYLCNLQGLVDLTYMTDDDLSYERNRFSKTLPQLRQRAKIRQSLPDGLAGVLQGLAAPVSSEELNLLEGAKND